MPGTITNRGKDKYKLTVSLGSDINGKPIRKSKTFSGTEAAAKRELAVFYADCLSGSISVESNMTLEQFYKTWFEEYAIPRLKKSTVIGYKKVFKNNVQDYIGQAKLTKIKPINIQKWINELSKTLSSKSVRNAYSLVSFIFDTAVRWA